MRCKMVFAAATSLIAASASAATPVNGLWRRPDDGRRAESVTSGAPSPVAWSARPGQPPLWKGKMYRPVDGETDSASLKLLDAGALKLTGCVVAWTRVR